MINSGAVIAPSEACVGEKEMKRQLTAFLLIILAGCVTPQKSVDELESWDRKTEAWLIDKLGKPKLEESESANVPDLGTGQGVADKIQKLQPGYTNGVRHFQWYSSPWYYDAYLVNITGTWIVVDAVKWRKDVQF